MVHTDQRMLIGACRERLVQRGKRLRPHAAAVVAANERIEEYQRPTRHRRVAANLEGMPGKDLRHQLRDESYPRGIFEDHPIDEMLRTNDPRFFCRNLEIMIATARIHGSEIALMTFAVSGKVGKRRDFLASEVYQQALHEHNGVIQELCRTHGLTCYDFASEMPRNRRLWKDPVHVNEDGARRKASLVADFLASSGQLPERRGEAFP